MDNWYNWLEVENQWTTLVWLEQVGSGKLYSGQWLNWFEVENQWTTGLVGTGWKWKTSGQWLNWLEVENQWTTGLVELLRTIVDNWL